MKVDGEWKCEVSDCVNQSIVQEIADGERGVHLFLAVRRRFQQSAAEAASRYMPAGGSFTINSCSLAGPDVPNPMLSCDATSRSGGQFTMDMELQP